MKKLSGLVVCACLAAVLATVAQGAIVHRYDFNGDPNDSVGNAHGTLINNTGRAAYANGQLVLGNVGAENSNDSPLIADYVDLPNGIISALGDQASFEVWTTWRGGRVWERIFDFGTSNGGEDVSPAGDATFYIFMTPMCDWENYDPLRFGMNKPVPSREERVLNGETRLTAATEQHLVVSWDGADKSVKMFLNGQLVDEGEMHFALSDITDNNNWLGRSQYNDPMYVGNYNEFRIYDHAMSAGEVAASLAAGREKSPANPVSPANGAQDVPLTPTLEWAPGYLPAGTTNLTYTLYFSNNAQAVESRSLTAKVGDFPGTSLAMPNQLLTDQTYYWLVDETALLPNQNEPNFIAGGMVSFQTPKTLPVLTAPTSLLYGQIGKSVVLTVNIVTASDVIDCTWYKYVDGTNDILLAEGAKYAIALSNEQTTLTITDLVAEDSGAYYCVVENAAGPQTSSNITVDVHKGLVHRYSFDGNAEPTDMTVVDSVSGMHGTLVVRTPSLNTRYENGMLILGNNGQLSNSGTGDYVDLPNGIISALGNMATFEMWVTWNGPTWNYWQRVFDFGTSNGGENASPAANDTYYVMLTSWGGANMLRTGYMRGTGQTPNGGDAPNGTERWVDANNGPLIPGRQTHIAVVWDGPNHTVRLYRDGRQVGQDTALHFALSDIADNNNWLGRAQWNDGLFRGSFDEFRIYDVPLSAEILLAHAQAGPDAPDAELTCTAYPTGDINADCVVNLSDLAIVADTWLTCGGPVCEE